MSIHIVDYNPEWPSYYAAEQAAISKALGSLCIDTYHIGSTAVPGLCGKPSIDIAITVQHTTAVHVPLQALGYQYKGEFNVPLRPFFSKRCPHYSVNLHVYTVDSPDLVAQRLLRDFLRDHPVVRQQYGDLLKKAANMPDATTKMANGMPTYNAYKHEFILHVLSLAGFDGFRACLCGAPAEWAAYQAMRQRAQQATSPAQSSTAHPVHTSQGHALVLYRGAQIVAAAHVSMIGRPQGKLDFIGTQDPLQSRVYKTQLLETIAQWIVYKGGNSLLVMVPHREVTWLEALGFSVVYRGHSTTLSRRLTG